MTNMYTIQFDHLQRNFDYRKLNLQLYIKYFPTSTDNDGGKNLTHYITKI